MSHKGDHSGFSEMLLGQGKRGGGGGVEREDDKGNRNGFAEISLGWETFGELNATFDDDNGSALISGYGFRTAI